MQSDSAERTNRKKTRFSKLSAKIAFWGGSGALAGSVVLDLLLLEVPSWLHVVFFCLVGVVVYYASHWQLTSRLDLAQTTLRQVRKHQFHNLEAAHLPRGDEMNALIWQVYRAGLAMEKELQELRKIENYRKEFLGDVSHELKTPIFAIQGYVETLQGGALHDERVNESFLQRILVNTKRLSHLANDLVEISRIESGEMEMSTELFHLREVASEVIEGLEHLAKRMTVSISQVIAKDLPRIQGDRSRINQVLINLVENAIKYSNPGGAIEIVGRLLPSGDVKVSVVDNGIGIAPQHIPRLTERFFRVDKSRSREQGGTGLGLAIVKHILSAHNTRMVVESKLGHGSTFGFTLLSELSPPGSNGQQLG